MIHNRIQNKTTRYINDLKCRFAQRGEQIKTLIAKNKNQARMIKEGEKREAVMLETLDRQANIITRQNKLIDQLMREASDDSKRDTTT